jgi:hypothetical protein
MLVMLVVDVQVIVVEWLVSVRMLVPFSWRRCRIVTWLRRRYSTLWIRRCSS